MVTADGAHMISPDAFASSLCMPIDLIHADIKLFSICMSLKSVLPLFIALTSNMPSNYGSEPYILESCEMFIKSLCYVWF